ncbi:hypothetical protein AC1031_011774 [Aphanomyces cochlioides]|nr:hypothetical protein AC1031_011774 [Aphanomyces cochlioides]
MIRLRFSHAFRIYIEASDTIIKSDTAFYHAKSKQSLLDIARDMFDFALRRLGIVSSAESTASQEEQGKQD